MAPVMIVGETYHGSAKPARVGRFLEEAEVNDAD
jgi:NADH:ubiquinone oxidoreductase subunit E